MRRLFPSQRRHNRRSSMVPGQIFRVPDVSWGRVRRSFRLVPGGGVEPPRPEGRRILSPRMRKCKFRVSNIF